MLRVMRIVKIEKVEDLTTNYAPGKPFSIFIAPVVGGAYLPGDVAIVNGTLPETTTATDVPVMVGDWSPVVFDSITASSLDLENCELYASELEIQG